MKVALEIPVEKYLLHIRFGQSIRDNAGRSNEASEFREVHMRKLYCGPGRI